jgi:hypothetical protein
MMAEPELLILVVHQFNDTSTIKQHEFERLAQYIRILTVYDYFPIWVRFGVRNVHIMLIRENRQREDLNLMGVNNIPYKFVPCMQFLK